MTELEWRVQRWLETLRAEGNVVVAEHELQVRPEVWRTTMRKAARRAGLRVRTGLSCDGGAVWAYHVDHVVTPAEEAASVNTVAALIVAGGSGPSCAKRLATERRKRLRSVSDVNEAQE